MILDCLIFGTHSMYSTFHLLNILLREQYVQNWRSQVHESRSCLNYRIFKDEFQFERYLNDVPFNLAIQFLKFRCRNSKLPVVVGQYQNNDINERLCNLCVSNVIGDEYHYLFECSYFLNLRKKYLPRIYVIHPNAYKFAQLMTYSNKYILIKVCLFVKCILAHFR